eukprot:552278-Hanusia_phi.AAC.3
MRGGGGRSGGGRGKKEQEQEQEHLFDSNKGGRHPAQCGHASRGEVKALEGGPEDVDVARLELKASGEKKKPRQRL